MILEYCVENVKFHLVMGEKMLIMAKKAAGDEIPIKIGGQMQTGSTHKSKPTISPFQDPTSSNLRYT